MPVRLRIKDENDISVCSFEIENEDVFNVKTLYKRIYDHLVEEGWRAAEADGDDTNFETLYWERKNQSDGVDHHCWWRAYKVPNENSYYRYFLKIDFQTLNVKKVEVMHKGHKYGTNKGDLIIRLSAYLQLDMNNWSKEGVFKKYHGWFKKKHYYTEIDSYKKELYAEAYRINTLIKQYLQLKNPWANWGKSFHPEKGL